MKIGVLGAGNIGGTLGVKWALAGHDVMFGVRNPSDEKVRARVAQAGGNATAASPAQAILHGDVVLVSIPSRSMPEFLVEHGPALQGKVVIDATNDFGRVVMHRVDAIEAAAPDALVVRAFNSLGWEVFADPVIRGEQADHFYAGPAATREPVARLIADIGLRPVYLGDAAAFSVLDGMTRVWAALAFQQGHGRHTAFRLLSDA